MSVLFPLFILMVLAAAAMLAALILVRNVLYVCPPNEVLVFSGATPRTTSDGMKIGYRIVKGGRTLRIPLLETVDSMDLSNMIIELKVKGAYSKGGIPLTVQGIANIKVPGEEPLIHNTIERFLGKSRAEIMEVARETLEGNLRGVLSSLTPEQVNTDKEAFANRLTEEAEHDLSNLGLVLDTLKIQNVTDDVGYLDSIGRMRSAEVRRNAQIAEAQAKAQTAEQKWRNTMEAELGKLNAQIQVANADNARRVMDAQTKRGAVIAEQQAEVQALIAQTQAEIQMQDARIEQVKLQLEADVIQPAEAQRLQAEQLAKADASKIVEQGRATATVLKNLALTYRGSGTAGRDVLLMQKLVPTMKQVLESMNDVRIDKLTVLNQGSGGGGNLASQLVATNEQIKAATGIDVPQLVKDRFAAPGTPPPPPARPR
ncbi:MAG: flotillin family protein [Sandaracinaceae bacterium]|nr:flotillin family protein [Sandaracinaceae bacterium]